MSYSLQYRPLFTVSILQDYYLSEDPEAYHNDVNLRTASLRNQRQKYQLSRELLVRPTTETKQLLKDKQLVFKQNNAGFFIGIRVEGDNSTPPTYRPFIDLPAKRRLRFTLTVRDNAFYNFTNIPLQKTPAEKSGSLYYFSNKANNVVEHPDLEQQLYLSQPLPGFDPETAYPEGALILESGKLLESTEKTTQASEYRPEQWKCIYADRNSPPCPIEDFDNANPYSAGDIVNENDRIWVAKADVAAGPFQSDDWLEIYREGESLHVSIAEFDEANSYGLGDTIRIGQNIYAAKIVVNSGAWNPDEWRLIYTYPYPHLQFVSAQDRLALRPSIFRHLVANEIEAYESVQILLSSSEGNLLHTFRFTAEDPSMTNPTLTACELDLRDFPTGRYQLEVQAVDGTVLPNFQLNFYLDDELYQQRPFALIECFHQAENELGAYQWLDADNDNLLLQPNYQIRWKNRLTWWRYYYGESPSFSVGDSDVDNLDVPGTPNNRILRTKVPRALSHLAKRIQLQLLNENGDPVEQQVLPNPTVDMIYPESGKVFSEINMGGGLGPPE